jgi:hypothetical protein
MYINKMKRTFTLLTIAFITLITFTAKAQDDAPIKSYFGFFGGVSIPQGDFAKYTYDNNKAGFAKRGLTYGLDGAYYFYKSLGIGATISYMDNGELNQTDADNLAAGYTASFGADQSTVTAHNRYQTVNILLGPQYSFHYGKFILDLRASAGFIKVYKTPETSILLGGVTDQITTFYQRSASATVFAYSGNAALRYKLGDNLHLVLRGTYINSSGPSITNDGRATTIGRVVTKQPITAIQTSLGLNFSF